MFQVRLVVGLAYEIVTVYAVDFNHDAFLIGKENKFKWVCINECTPL